MIVGLLCVYVCFDFSLTSGTLSVLSFLFYQPLEDGSPLSLRAIPGQNSHTNNVSNLPALYGYGDIWHSLLEEVHEACRTENGK